MYLGHEIKQSTKHALHLQEQYKARGNPNSKVRLSKLNSSFIQGLKWTNQVADLDSMDAKRVLLSMLRAFDHQNQTLEQWNPMALQAKANDPDTPNWFEAMNGPFAERFWDACYKEINTLENMGVWDVVD
jgi:hypothetical protein